MAAKLKKRALAEYSQVIQEESALQPVKKLRLIHKVKPQEPPLSFQGVSNNEDILRILLRFENILPIEVDHLDHCLRLLLDQYYNCKDTAVRAKIAFICGQLSKSTNVDVSRIVSDLINLLKNEDSHKVVSQLLGALMICGCTLPLNRKLHRQVVSLAVKHLSMDSHLVKCKSLQILGCLATPVTDDQPSTSSDEGSRLHRILGEFTHDADSRVRTAAFEAMLRWHQRGIKLEQSVFDKASQALKDDYESVRSVATKLIWVTSQLYPDRKVKVSDTETENYLIDDGFAKICNMLNDSSVSVRAEAAALLGSLHGVSQKFLDQTLDKRLMSNMQRRITNKDKMKETLAGNRGGFSSGRKWADDTPKGEEEVSVAVMNMGACGAFVHGLEDEFMEVRNASIDSMCELATRSESFALQCVDSLVDMFNDEIEQIQLNAINSLRKISHVITLREEQLDVVMGCIKAFSFEVREAFRGLLSSVQFGNRDCIRTCILGQLDLLKKYPQDKPDLWQCMTKMGKNNEAFILSLAPELLSSHPYFEAVEPSITDPAYVSVLLLVFNASVDCPSMTQLFPEHTVNHYKYLRNTLPALVPNLRLVTDSTGLTGLSSPPRCTSPTAFLEQTVNRLGAVENLDSTGATQLIRMGIRDLERVSELEATLAPNASLMSMYLECHLCLSRILSNQGSSFISQIQSNTGALLKKVVSLTHQMEHQFLGVAIGDLSHILQLRVLAQSAQLLVLLTTNLTGMKQSCVQYLQLLNNFERYIQSHTLEPNIFTQTLLRNMQRLESCDPAVYHSVLLQALAHYKPQVLRLTNSVRKTRAEILEPVSSDKTISFITGLASAVDMIVVIEDMEDTNALRIQVKYPDQQVHRFVPKRADIKHLSESRHRLITKVLLSHQQWSGPCQVELSVGLSHKRQKEFSEDKSVAKEKHAEEYIQLCKPVKLTVAPKPLKK